MLNQVLYPVFDLVFYPLFWLPRIVSLTIVSIVFGFILLGLYRYSSDQWALAHYKEKIKTAQHMFFRGVNRWRNFLKIGRLNGKMAGLGLIPSAVCIGFLLIIIPWVGNRFGHYPFPKQTPIPISVTSSSSWSFENNLDLRFEPDTGPFPPGKSHVRLLAERSGPVDVTIKSRDEPNEIVLYTTPGYGTIWPTIQRPRWYYPLVNPAEQQLNKHSSLERIHINYEVVFSSLTFTIPYSGQIPGWLSWFFLVSFASGIWAKLRWEIE